MHFLNENYVLWWNGKIRNFLISDAKKEVNFHGVITLLSGWEEWWK